MDDSSRRPTIDLELAVFAFHEGQFSVVLHDVSTPRPLPRRAPGSVGLPTTQWTGETSLSQCLVALINRANIVWRTKPIFFEYLEPDDRRGIVLRYYMCANLAPKGLPESTYFFPARQNPIDLDHVIARLADDVGVMPLVPLMLGNAFTLSQLQEATEIVLGRQLDKRHFRRHFLETGWLQDSQKKTTGGAHRPATLYSVANPEKWLMSSPSALDLLLSSFQGASANGLPSS